MSATASTATQPKPLEWLNRLRANPRIPLIVAGSAAVAIVVAMVLWAKRPITARYLATFPIRTAARSSRS